MAALRRVRDGWVQIRHGFGPDAVQSAYLELVDGRSDPAVGHVLSLWPTAPDSKTLEKGV